MAHVKLNFSIKITKTIVKEKDNLLYKNLFYIKQYFILYENSLN